MPSDEAGAKKKQADFSSRCFFPAKPASPAPEQIHGDVMIVFCSSSAPGLLKPVLLITTHQDLKSKAASKQEAKEPFCVVHVQFISPGWPASQHPSSAAKIVTHQKLAKDIFTVTLELK